MRAPLAGGSSAVTLAAHFVCGVPHGCGVAADCRGALVPGMFARSSGASCLGKANGHWDKPSESIDVDLIHRCPHPDTPLFPSLVFGVLRDRSGSVVPPIAIHVFYNTGYFLIAGGSAIV